MSSRIEIGSVLGTHGIRGEVRFLSYGDLDLEPGQRLYLDDSDESAHLTVVSARPHKGCQLVLFEGVSGIDAAAALKKTVLFIDKADLPEPEEGEYYHFDLIGMDVVTDLGESLGKITGIIETGSKDVYEVEGPAGEILLPAIPDVILEVDLEENRMKVHLLEGLGPERA